MSELVSLLLRLRLLIFSFSAGTLFLLLLCLGSQNLSERHVLTLANWRSVPLPSGFIVGISFVVGVISGSSAMVVMIPEQRRD